MEELLRAGRFRGDLDPDLRALNASIGFDRRLYREDIRGSKAYARALERAGILAAREREEIHRGLEQIQGEIEAGTFPFAVEREDIHMNIEARLKEIIGGPAEKLHTGRSRNDQVATDLRMYIKEESEAIRGEIRRLALSLAELADREVGTVIPAYTHLQRASPVLLAHHMMAYVEMLRRDLERFEAARASADVLVLGSGACAGNPYGIDRELLREELGFASISRNSIDAVGDRDFVLDFLYASAVLMVHLSRMSEDLILWSSSEFGFVTMDDRVSTGSSILPQKRNPDACELFRGKTGRAMGHLLALMVALKGIPISYNKDLQEDKEGLFDTVDMLRLVLPVAATLFRTLRVNHDRIEMLLRSGHILAPLLADELTRKGLPFREAHRVVREIVAHAEGQGKELGDLEPDEIRRFSDLVDPDLWERLSLREAVERMVVVGGTSTERVRQEIARAKAEFAAADGPEEKVG